MDDTSHLNVHLRVCTHTLLRVFVHGQNAHVAFTPRTPPGAWTPQHRPSAYDVKHPGPSPGALPHPGHSPGAPPSPAAT